MPSVTQRSFVAEERRCNQIRPAKESAMRTSRQITLASGLSILFLALTPALAQEEPVEPPSVMPDPALDPSEPPDEAPATGTAGKGASSASATTVRLEFDPPSLPGGSRIISDWSEKGFLVTLAGTWGHSADGQSLSPNNGSAFLQSLAGGSPLSLVQSNGQPFTAVRVDLAEYSTVFPTPRDIVFVGHRGGVPVATQTFTLDGIIDGSGPGADFQTFAFNSSFTNLDRLSATPDGYSIDNLELEVADTPPPVCAPTPSGLVSWWRGENNGNDDTGANQGLVQSGVSFAPGKVGQAFVLNGTPNSYVEIQTTNGLNFTGNTPMSVEFWAYRTGIFSVSANLHFLGKRAPGCGGFQYQVASDPQTGGIQFGASGGSAGTGVVMPLNAWVHVAGTYDGTTFRIYTNGVLGGSFVGSLGPQNSARLRLGNSSGECEPFIGLLDEVAMYNRALSGGEILSIFNAGSAGKCDPVPQPPLITSQPQDRVAAVGTSTSFAVTATGTAPLAYQWYFNDAPIGGATSSTLALVNLQLTDAGIYRVTVSNDLGSVTSSNATLTVIDLGPNLFDDFDPTIDALQWSAFGGTVLATNHGGFVSGPNSLWFGGTGSRFAATRSLNTLIGGDISFYLRFGNANNPWERVDLPNEGVVLEYSLNNGTSWNLIATYNTSNFLTGWQRVDVPVPAAAQSSNTRFRWRQLANSGSANDHWALDDVSILLEPTPPSFSAQPTNQIVPLGTNVTITAGVRGSRPLTFQWRFNGADLPGATNAALALSNVQPTQVGLYSVAVANAYGSATSDAMLLLVTPPISSLTVPALDTGWYDATGFHGPTSGNYMAGDTTSLTRVPPYRNFFVFNVPNFSNAVASASFRVRTFNIVSPTGSEDFELNEVTTPIGVLREGGSNRVAVWEDLADGPVYGTRTFTTAERSNLVDIPLSPAAVSGILAARGAGFALGGEITSLDATFRNNEFVFGSSTSASSNNAFLVVNFVPPPSPPALSALPDQTIDEDSVLGPLTFAVYDAQTTASNLVLTAASSNPALVPDGAIVIGGTDIVRSLTVTPAANQHGTTVVSLIALDGDGNSTTNQFTLTVLPVNDPPVADASATLLTLISPNNVDAQVVLDGSLSSDVDGDALTHTWRDGNTDALLAGGVVATITRPVGANPIVLVVSDGLLEDTDTISVVVKSAAQAVQDLVAFLNGVTVPRNKQALLASLEAASASFADGNFTAGINQLEAFQHKVRAQVGPDDPVLADTLISLAQGIIDALAPSHGGAGAGLLRTEMSFTAVRQLPNGRVKLHFPGWASRVYLIQASTDMVTWETIGTGRHLGKGAFEFEDAHASQRTQRYYRIALP
jgi:hypothetical protein